MEPRLILPGLLLEGTIKLSPEDEKHIFSVLRLREGSGLVLCDGNGREAVCTITASRGVRVVATAESCGEPRVCVHLYPSLSKGERFEWMLQKAVELGAASVTPVLSERCVAGLPSADKMNRYKRIIRSAAEQSGRGKIPEMRNPLLYKDISKFIEGHVLFCYEEERTRTLKEALREGAHDVSVLTGPEGGYSPEEASIAAENGWDSVTLGNRILRCETAPLMVLSVLEYLAERKD